MKRETTMLGLTSVAVLCAVVITAAVVKEMFWPVTVIQDPPPPPSQPPVFVTGWQKYLEGGHWMGPADAKVVILVFGDFECPACARVEREAIGPIRRKFPTQVAVVFRHWPLSYHRFAYPAARASECAAAQGRFEAYHDLLYAKQDSLGLRSFHDFAVAAGATDLVGFDSCNASAAPVPRIEADMKAVKAMGGNGTPTLLVNGWQMFSLPDSASLEVAVLKALGASGQKP